MMAHPRLNHKNKTNNHMDDIIDASYNNDVTTVKALIADGTDVNSREERTGFSPLHIAVAKNFTKLFNLLLAQPNIDLWALDRWERTPGVIAIDNGDISGFATSIETRAAGLSNQASGLENSEPN